jgi:hypothetical protein
MFSTAASATGFDKDGKFDGTKKNFWAYHSKLMATLESHSTRWIIEKTIREPLCPREAFAKYDRGEALTDEEHKRIDKYTDKYEKHEKDAEKCLGVIKNSLNSIPYSLFRLQIDATTENINGVDYEITNRRKCQRIVEAMIAYYGTPDVATKIAVQRDMEALPSATDSASAIFLMTGMVHINSVLRQWQAPYDDAILKTKLLEKLDSAMFDNIAEKINSNPEYTFEKACQEVRASLELQTMRSSKRSATTMKSIYTPSSSSSSSPSNPEDYLSSVFAPSNPIKRSRTEEQPPTSVLAISAEPAINTVDANTVCWNCQSSGHQASNCTALHCRRCQTFFYSKQDPKYHMMTNCSMQTTGNQFNQRGGGGGNRGGYGGGRGNDRGSGRGNYGGRGNGSDRNGRDRQNSDRGRGARPGGRNPTYIRQTNISTMTAEPSSQDQQWDEYCDRHATADEHADDYDDQEEYEVWAFEACQQPCSAVSLVDALRCLQDSGANVNACPPELVQSLHLPIHPYRQPIRVVFGNGTVVHATHYTYIGILGKTAIVKGCRNTIISIPTMNQRGYDVLFQANMKCVVSRGQQVILNTPIDREKSLYFVNVRELLNTSDCISEPAQVTTLHANSHRIGKQTVIRVQKLHNVLCHAASPAVMARALRYGAWLNVEVLPTDVEQVFKHQQCLSCMIAKAKRLARADGTGLKPTVFGMCASVDWKPVTPPALSGEIGFYLFVEDTVGFKFSVTSHHHDSAHLLQAIKEYVSYLRKYSHRLKKLRFDAGTVENSKLIENEVALLEILTDAAPPECQFQNPVERHIQTTVKGIATMFAAQQLLRRYYWTLALIAYIKAVNVCPNSNSPEVSPEFHLTQHHPDIGSRFKFFFGEPVVSVILHQQRSANTFAPRGELGIAIGSGPGSNNTATLVLIPSRSIHRVYLRHDVRSITAITSEDRTPDEIEAMQPTLLPDGTVSIPAFKVANLSSFDLAVHPALQPLKDMPPEDDDVSILISDMSSSDADMWPLASGGVATVNKSSDDAACNSPPVNKSSDDDAAPNSPSLNKSSDDDTSNSPSIVEHDNTLISPPDPTIPDSTPETEHISHRLRSRDIAHVNFLSGEEQLTHYSDTDDFWQELYEWKDEPDEVQINSVKKIKTEEQADHDGEDVSTKYAQESDEWETIWEPAAQAEFTVLKENSTGQEIPYDEIPPDAPILPSKMLFKKKLAADGTFDKAKARLVVCGNWITSLFISLFAPTVNEKSMKIMFALAIVFGLVVTGIDIKGAFLYPDLKRPVYIVLPKNLTGFPHVYWKLNKTLYGLPESPQAFYEDVSKLLMKNGYARTNADPCMFYMRKNGHFIMFTVHVDDFACASSSTYMTNRLLQVLRTRYTITTDNSLESYLGINIHYNPDGSMTLTQPRRIHELIEAYGPEFEHMPPPSIPMSSTFNDAQQDDSPLYEYTPYMSLLGKLIHIIKTRPDIAYAVNRLATRAQHATKKDYQALLRIVAYLKATSHLGIRMRPGTWDPNSTPKLYGYLDAAYACHADSKSHTGYSFCFNDPSNAMFFSRTMKQTNVTLSSTEAENAAAVESTKEALWFRQLLMDLGFAQLEPTVMFSDSASMITLASNYSGNHKRVKHYITRVNFMIEQVQKGHIQLKHVSGTENVSDMLTKPLGPQDFIRLRAHLLGMQ